MAPSATANNIIGAFGAGVLAICCAPQLLKLIITKRSKDLSYWWMILYSCGLVLTMVYLYYQEALVGWIGILVEITFATSLVIGKTWCDYYGPFSPRGQAKARAQGRSTAAAVDGRPAGDGSHSSQQRHWQTTLSAAPALFPVLVSSHGPSHPAQQLLLDCCLSAPGLAGGDGAFATQATAPVANGAGTASSKSKHNSLAETAIGEGTQATLPDVALMLEHALIDAKLQPKQLNIQRSADLAGNGGLLPEPQQQQQQQNGALPHGNGFAGQSGPDVEVGLGQVESATGGTNRGTAATRDHPEMQVFSCLDGSATLLWYGAAATLALDLAALSPTAVNGMNAAAQHFCRGLSARWPDGRIAISALPRLCLA